MEAARLALLSLYLVNTYRIFNCVLCAKQVILCRPCDRGNQYCSLECSRLQRRRSLLRAGTHYQKSFAGKRAHAARQAKYRERLAASNKKVTHHGSQLTAQYASKKDVTAEKSIRVNDDFRRTLARTIRCHQCGRNCGPFGRLDVWRGGRNYKKFRRLHGHNTGHRGGDNPPVPR